MTTSERKKYLREITTVNRRFELKFFSKIQKAIKDNISSLIEYMRLNGVESAADYFNQNMTSPELTKVVEELYSKVGTYHADRTYRSLIKETKGFGFKKEWVMNIINYFRQHLVEHITYGAVETMRDFFLPSISKAITEGRSFELIAQEIRDKGFEKWQAARIVRTEVNSASNVGVVVAADSYEYKSNKEWLSALDDRVRGLKKSDHANHALLNGTVLDFEDYFTDPESGVKLFQPGDPKAKGLKRDVAATVINCRCTIAISPKRDENGRLIKK